VVILALLTVFALLLERIDSGMNLEEENMSD
jgi:hypothetical protein